MRKSKHYYEEKYKDYTIYLFRDWDNDIVYEIYEEYLPGKWKCRRSCITNKPIFGKDGKTAKRDEMGNKLYTTFENDQEAIDKAKNYIDNHIVRWVDSPHYKAKS